MHVLSGEWQGPKRLYSFSVGNIKHLAEVGLCDILSFFKFYWFYVFLF